MRLTVLLRRSAAAPTPPAFAELPLHKRFVPAHRQPPAEYIARLDAELAKHRRLLVLTGAGISTESGIPDYRSEGVGLYMRAGPVPTRPTQHSEFLRSAAMRQRYWARNFIAWPRFSAFRPNATHEALARFERDGRLTGLITQNVDRLHRKAGSRAVLELHGHTADVICVGNVAQSRRGCDYRIDRGALQAQLEALNVRRLPRGRVAETALRPDGDVDVPAEFMAAFEVPACPRCGGVLKPDVVFFGDSVPRERFELADRWLAESDALLVLGSSLLIMSAYRIVVQAHESQLPVVIVNIGPTRGDGMATIKLAAKCGDVVPKLFGGCGGAAGST